MYIRSRSLISTASLFFYTLLSLTCVDLVEGKCSHKKGSQLVWEPLSIFRY